MITLKTLPQATAQEVFDQITQHLLRQGKAARTATGACLYRVETVEGILKCAAGCLIADDEYDNSFEGVIWSNLINAGKVPTIYGDLIRDLQRAHDNEVPSEWPGRFELIATKYNLTYNPQQS